MRQWDTLCTHPIPVTETQKHSAYEGCYALSRFSKKLCLGSTTFNTTLTDAAYVLHWIMEKDDFKYSMSFGEDVFGPRWSELVGVEDAQKYQENGTVPIMLDPQGEPVQRNFVHVEDLVAAILLAIQHPKAKQELFNISMDEPVDYGNVAKHLLKTRSAQRFSRHLLQKHLAGQYKGQIPPGMETTV